MVFYPESAVERAMKIQEVILRAMAKRLTWCQAAEIIGISDRQMRRWYRRYQEFGYDGLFDRRRGRPSPKRVAVETVERMLGLYRDRYFDLNVQHFCEKLREEHSISLSYTWVQDGPARSRALWCREQSAARSASEKITRVHRLNFSPPRCSNF